MKKTFPFRFAPWLLAVNAAIVILLGGCATQEEHSYNTDFGETLPAQPMYAIKDETDQHFTIRLHQGVPPAIGMTPGEARSEPPPADASPAAGIRAMSWFLTLASS